MTMKYIPKPKHANTMSEKLVGLRATQTTLTKKLELGFDTDAYRELNIVNHKIAVTEERKKGGWEKPGLHLPTIGNTK